MKYTFYHPNSTGLFVSAYSLSQLCETLGKIAPWEGWIDDENDQTWELVSEHITRIGVVQSIILPNGKREAFLSPPTHQNLRDVFMYQRVTTKEVVTGISG